LFIVKARKLGSNKKIYGIAWTGSIKQANYENTTTKGWNGRIFCHCFKKKMI